MLSGFPKMLFFLLFLLSSITLPRISSAAQISALNLVEGQTRIDTTASKALRTENDHEYSIGAYSSMPLRDPPYEPHELFSDYLSDLKKIRTNFVDDKDPETTQTWKDVRPKLHMFADTDSKQLASPKNQYWDQSPSSKRNYLSVSKELQPALERLKDKTQKLVQAARQKAQERQREVPKLLLERFLWRTRSRGRLQSKHRPGYKLPPSPLGPKSLRKSFLKSESPKSVLDHGVNEIYEDRKIQDPLATDPIPPENLGKIQSPQGSQQKSQDKLGELCPLKHSLKSTGPSRDVMRLSNSGKMVACVLRRISDHEFVAIPPIFSSYDLGQVKWTPYSLKKNTNEYKITSSQSGAHPFSHPPANEIPVFRFQPSHQDMKSRSSQDFVGKMGAISKDKSYQAHSTTPKARAAASYYSRHQYQEARGELRNEYLRLVNSSGRSPPTNGHRSAQVQVDEKGLESARDSISVPSSPLVYSKSLAPKTVSQLAQNTRKTEQYIKDSNFFLKVVQKNKGFEKSDPGHSSVKDDKIKPLIDHQGQSTLGVHRDVIQTTGIIPRLEDGSNIHKNMNPSEMVHNTYDSAYSNGRPVSHEGDIAVGGHRYYKNGNSATNLLTPTYFRGRPLRAEDDQSLRNNYMHQIAGKGKQKVTQIDDNVSPVTSRSLQGTSSRAAFDSRTQGGLRWRLQGNWSTRNWCRVPIMAQSVLEFIPWNVVALNLLAKVTFHSSIKGNYLDTVSIPGKWELDRWRSLWKKIKLVNFLWYNLEAVSDWIYLACERLYNRKKVFFWIQNLDNIVLWYWYGEDRIAGWYTFVFFLSSTALNPTSPTWTIYQKFIIFLLGTLNPKFLYVPRYPDFDHICLLVVLTIAFKWFIPLRWMMRTFIYGQTYSRFESLVGDYWVSQSEMK